MRPAARENLGIPLCPTPSSEMTQACVTTLSFFCVAAELRSCQSCMVKTLGTDLSPQVVPCKEMMALVLLQITQEAPTPSLYNLPVFTANWVQHRTASLQQFLI